VGQSSATLSPLLALQVFDLGGLFLDVHPLCHLRAQIRGSFSISGSRPFHSFVNARLGRTQGCDALRANREAPLCGFPCGVLRDLGDPVQVAFLFEAIERGVEATSGHRPQTPILV